MPRATITADDIRDLLTKKWPQPAYAALHEIRNGTGFRKRERYADMLVISVWPSRGVYTIGVEIKVSRSDWRKEAADPSKADAIAKYCKYWYVAAPKGIVPIDEVPETWGLIECTKAAAKTTKAAPERTPEPPDWFFVASVLRGIEKQYIPASVVMKRVADARRQKKEDEDELWKLRREIGGYGRLKRAVADFEEASGVKIDLYHGRRIGDAVQTVLSGGLDGLKSAIHRIKQNMEIANKACDGICESIDEAGS